MGVPNCWHLQFSVQDGVVVVSSNLFDGITMVGSSCPATLGEGSKTEVPFKVFPQKNDELVLVLVHHGEDRRAGLIHITYRNEKWVAKHDPAEIEFQACLSVNYQVHTGGIQVVSNGIRFTSDRSAKSTKGAPAKHAHPTSILRFITGRIGHEQLVKEARKFNRDKVAPVVTAAEVPAPATMASIDAILKSAIREIDGHVSVECVKLTDGVATALLVCPGDDRFRFWRQFAQEDTPTTHPSLSDAPLLGTIQADGSLGGQFDLVSKVVGLSRTRNPNDMEAWASVLDDTSCYAKGCALVLQIDVDLLRRDNGADALLRFVNAALLREDAAFITISEELLA